MLQIAITAPIFCDDTGRLDHELNARYAERVAATWVQHVVIAGPMGRGEACTPSQRTDLLRIWVEHVDPSRLIVACWTAQETESVSERGMRALAMLAADSDDQLLHQLRTLPPLTIAYTNPRYSRSTITPALLTSAAHLGCMPNGLKFSKVSVGGLARARSIAGPDVTIIHGSSRRIADSIAAGATIVGSSPLAALASPWPPSTIDAVQRAADGLQAILDQQDDHLGRVAEINNLARTSLTGV